MVRRRMGWGELRALFKWKSLIQKRRRTIGQMFISQIQPRYFLHVVSNHVVTQELEAEGEDEDEWDDEAKDDMEEGEQEKGEQDSTETNDDNTNVGNTGETTVEKEIVTPKEEEKSEEVPTKKDGEEETEIVSPDAPTVVEEEPPQKSGAVEGQEVTPDQPVDAKGTLVDCVYCKFFDRCNVSKL